jgi:hypothetical protein
MATEHTPYSCRARSQPNGEALVLAEDLGMDPLVAHCHLGLGTLYWQTHQLKRTQGHLIAAAKMYREMGMKFYLEHAEAWSDRVGLTVSAAKPT